MLVKHHWCIVNIDKEEKWIRSMNESGKRLLYVRTSTGRYEFDEPQADDERQIVKMDVRTFRSKADFEDYKAMFEDSGWRHIGGTKSSGVQYFEKVSEDASEDIFSDKASKAERYRRLANMWLTSFLCFLPLTIVLYHNTMKEYDIFHPKSLYFTPGLWELKGSRFVGAFLFETPFAIGRGFMWLVMLVIILSYLFFTIKSYYWYRKEK
ncbi:hypothetical protein lbkm_0863 [Lachnospiraceae bacterium KM106-2]|nr:hypothetical protein lbkm_0863 [Lachnospiraceae bacterium KM106-2]